VRVRVTELAASVSITVTNDGEPIARNQVHRILDRSWSESDAEGRGLGLPIARQIAEAHGGTLSVNSPDADTATTFILTMVR